jgi:hypothetical protein
MKASPTEQFDPLLSGQLAIDAPSTNNSREMLSPEENLLKEWNLDFGKMNKAAVPPPRPSATYASSPHIGFWTAPRGQTPHTKAHTLGPHVSSIMNRLNAPHGTAKEDPFGDLVPPLPQSQPPQLRTSTPIAPTRQSKQTPAAAPAAWERFD